MASNLLSRIIRQVVANGFLNDSLRSQYSLASSRQIETWFRDLFQQTPLHISTPASTVRTSGSSNRQPVSKTSPLSNSSRTLASTSRRRASDTSPPRATLLSGNVTKGGGITHTFRVRYRDNRAVNVSTLDSQDLLVKGPNGFSQKAQFVRVNRRSNGADRVATYRITAPGFRWDGGDNGRYRIYMQGRQVNDTSGNSAPRGLLGSFRVNIDTTPPAARLTTSDVSGGDRHTFTVVYTDATAVRLSSLDSRDIRVVGPNGFSQLAELVSTSRSANAKRITATYRIMAPGGEWTGSDGTYTISLVGRQVRDTRGNLTPPQVLGSFKVDTTLVPINGTNAANTIAGDARNNLIRGLDGADILRGNGGNDVLIGGKGNDTLDGGPGNDTVSYAEASNGVVADLSLGKASRIARILPLGDSITYGVISSASVNNTESGGYRTYLWQKFTNDGITIDFVGSQTNGPSATLGDRNHEGNRGKTIDWLEANIINNQKFSTANPDVVLLMIGTNDIGENTVPEMLDELESLIDRIAAFSPDLKLFVASIPPSNTGNADRTTKTTQYNNALPGLITDKQNQGKNVSFVDMRSLTTADISGPPADNGLHPTAAGYQKIANFWFDALASLGVDQGTYSVDKDTLISIENLIGSNYNDVLIGNGGANVLEGGNGSDRLTGGGGSDTFVYNSSSHGGDTITDFGNDDLLRISASGFGGGLSAGKALSNGVASANGVFVSGGSPSPVGTSGNFLYNSNTGALRFDPDGTGASSSILIATLTGAPALSANQFSIVS